MADMVRVTLLPKDVDGDSAGDRPIILDMVIDESGTAVGPFPAFGRVGDFRKPETLYPFTLMMDGRMDYGASAEASANQAKLEIRKAVLAVGAEIAHVGPSGSETFAISALTPLTMS